MRNARYCSLVSGTIALVFLAGAACAESEAERKVRRQTALDLAEKLSLVNASSKPLDRPFEDIERMDELLAFRHTLGHSGAERVEITEYVSAKTNRLYACRVAGTKPRECLEIVPAVQ